MALSFIEYQTIVEQAPIMIWRADTTKKCNYFNQTWLAFTGRTFEQELGDGWAEGVHAEDFARCLETYLTSFDRQIAFEMHYRLRRHDGVYRWIFDRGVPFLDETGQFAGYIGSCVDVTETVEAQEAIKRASEMELRMLRGLLSICAHCKRIRNDQGVWEPVEIYVRKRTEADFSHGICPACVKEHFPDI